MIKEGNHNQECFMAKWGLQPDSIFKSDAITLYCTSLATWIENHDICLKFFMSYHAQTEIYPFSLLDEFMTILKHKDKFLSRLPIFLWSNSDAYHSNAKDGLLNIKFQL